MKGLDEFRAQLDEIVSRLPATAATITNQGAALVAGNVKINIRRVFSSRQQGGQGLAGSVQIRDAVLVGAGSSSQVLVGKVYARIQEKGGTIVPKNKPMLAWQDPDSGDWIFAHQVTLPARPYFAPAMRASAEPFRALARERLMTMLESV